MPSEGQVMMDADWLQPSWPLQSEGVRSFMTTRAGGVSGGAFGSMNVGAAVQDDPAAVAENRARVDRALAAKAVFLRQVHGSEVVLLNPSHALHAAEAPVADASVSTLPGLAVAIQVADCLPVLFAAPGGVAGAHAGWRGLAGGVLENTVAALCRAAACQPADVQAWLGACIGPEAFEVGPEVLGAFGARSDAESSEFFRFRPNAMGEARWRADLPGLARQRLFALGLTQVGGGSWCTFSDASRFFSYRREHVSGRMVAAICLA
ncbi:peptidoglycan editing factor PgeF [Roseateles oligotrophus]|uniref:Purine nucleoside phosphorylase n=1 Tax=Roseateles oligotrophus TaxID=1769250 RepID=A0ABT2YGF7_9BURK|nr:peptidoglycan editing factor PgeF [Roseateles oligotrophus]MCV2369125.1 peptidoglycan editing factor PgeF [Roseateles oligotrophus]